MDEKARTQNEAAEMLEHIKAAFIAFAEAFQIAYAETLERAIRFCNELNEIMFDIDENRNGQIDNRQRVAELSQVKSCHSLLRSKRINHQVTVRTPMYPVKKII